MNLGETGVDDAILVAASVRTGLPGAGRLPDALSPARARKISLIIRFSQAFALFNSLWEVIRRLTAPDLLSIVHAH